MRSRNREGIPRMTSREPRLTLSGTDFLSCRFRPVASTPAGCYYSATPATTPATSITSCPLPDRDPVHWQPHCSRNHDLGQYSRAREGSGATLTSTLTSTSRVSIPSQDDSILMQRLEQQAVNKPCTLVYTSGTTGNPKVGRHGANMYLYLTKTIVYVSLGKPQYKKKRKSSDIKRNLPTLVTISKKKFYTESFSGHVKNFFSAPKKFANTFESAGKFL